MFYTTSLPTNPETTISRENEEGRITESSISPATVIPNDTPSVGLTERVSTPSGSAIPLHEQNEPTALYVTSDVSNGVISEVTNGDTLTISVDHLASGTGHDTNDSFISDAATTMHSSSAPSSRQTDNKDVTGNGHTGNDHITATVSITGHSEEDHNGTSFSEENRQNDVTTTITRHVVNNVNDDGFTGQFNASFDFCL